MGRMEWVNEAKRGKSGSTHDPIHNVLGLAHKFTPQQRGERQRSAQERQGDCWRPDEILKNVLFRPFEAEHPFVLPAQVQQ